MIESGMEIQDVMGKLEEGACWGHWAVSEHGCSKCVIMAQCSDATKKRQSGAAAIGPTEPLPSKDKVEELPDTDPLDYMLKTLEGKYSRTTKTKSGGTIERFSDEDGVVIMIAIAKDGRIRITSGKGKKAVSSLESHEQVEELLGEMI